MDFTLTRSHDIPAAADATWAVVADYRRDPEWRRGVTVMEASTTGPAIVGTTTHEVLRLAGQTYVNDGVVDEVVAGRRLVWHTVEGADAHGSRTVEPLADGRCRVTLSLTVRPHGLDAVMAPLARRMLDRNLRGDLARLASLVATEARASVAAA